MRSYGNEKDVAQLLCPRPSTSVAMLPFLAFLFAGCQAEAPAPVSAPEETSTNRFSDVTASVGILHRHVRPVLDAKLANIMPWMTSIGAAAAAGDFDGDGWIDLYVTNSRKGTQNFLYRNQGDGSFIEMADAAGVAALNGEDGVSMDCVWGDYDNDGRQDLYVVRWGRDALLHNDR